METPKAPNIPDLARRGGLLDHSPNAQPYSLGIEQSRLHVLLSGNNTTTVHSFTLSGLQKEVNVAWHYCDKFQVKDPAQVAAKYTDFQFLGVRWIGERLMASERSTEKAAEIAREIYKEILAQEPELKKWPAPECDDRPVVLKNGELVERYYEELKKLGRACKPKRLAESKLRLLRPTFQIWPVIHKMKTSLRDELFNIQTGNIAEAKDTQLFEAIGSVFDRGADCVAGWRKEYRKLSGTSRKRRRKLP